jgi:nucleoside-diphosphate-sugar epimerase
MQPRPPLNSNELELIQSQLVHCQDQLRNAHLFITGGTGFFGRWLVESFLHFNSECRLGAKLTVLSRDPARFLASAPHLKSDCIRFVKGDVRDFAFPNDTFTHIIHAATDASETLNSESPLKMFDVIVGGTRRVLDFASQSSAGRMLFVSSGAVYGPQTPEVAHVTEEMFFGFTPNDPRIAYAEGKRAAEFLCSVYARNEIIKIPVARCFAFVGPHLPLDAHFAIGNFLNDRIHGRTIRVAGDGSPLRSYLYASDMAAWLWMILLKGESGRAYNVGSNKAISIGDLALKIAMQAGLEVSIGLSHKADNPRNQYVPSVDRAVEELGCNLSVPLDLAISKTIAFHTP